MTATHSQFTPSATATYPVASASTAIALPAVDNGNPAVVLRNLGPGVVAVMSGTISGSVFNAPGAIILQPGQTLLANSPGLSTSTAATAVAQGGAQLQVWRGALADVFLFPAQTPAVF